MVNAWVSKKPIKYWRAFAPKDIPLDNNKPLIYYEWNNFTKTWECNILSPISRTWSSSNIKKMISRHNKLIEGGIHETVIVEVHPKFEIGKYKNIEIINIYSENTQYRSQHEYKIYETEYYIKYKNDTSIVTETELINMTTKSNHCFVYTYQKGKNNFLHIRSKTNNPKREKQYIKLILSTPGLKFDFPHKSSYLYNNINDENWKYISTNNIPIKVWNISKQSEPTVEYDNDKNIVNMFFTFIDFKKYYEGQIAKIKASNIRDGLDLAFLKAIQTKSTKIALSHNRNKSKVSGCRCKGSLRDNFSKENQLNGKKEKMVYIIYTKPQRSTIRVPKQVTIHKNKVNISTKKIITKEVEVTEKCPEWTALKLQERFPDLKVLTIPEYNRQQSVKFQKEKFTKSILHPDGMFNRKTRRLEKQKNRKYNRSVKIQQIYVPIKDAEKYPQIAKNSWSNKNGHENKAVFINRNNITNSVIKVNDKLIERDSTKLIYHDTSSEKHFNITRHNAKKRNINPILEELRNKYIIYDRRYTVNSDVENWSIQFFIVLKMIKEKERHKKIVRYLKDNCKLSDEFINGFIQYLHLTKNGDPTREHKGNRSIHYKRIMVTKPHLLINSPDPREPLIIEHEVKNEESGGIKNIITEDVTVHYNKKDGMQFFKYNKETNDHVLISKARDIKKWVYLKEYNADPKKVKWHELVSVETKEVPKVIREVSRLERKVIGSKIKSWKSPIPEEKTVRYIIKKLNILYKTEKYDLLYSLIYNTIMEYYRNNDSLYNAIRFALYHNYSDLSKKLITLIKVNKMDDPDLVIFMEDLLHPH